MRSSRSSNGNDDSGLYYRFRLWLYHRARQSSLTRFLQRRRRPTLLVVIILATISWIMLNETFALKLILEQECFEQQSHVSWNHCLHSTVERWTHILTNSQASKFHLENSISCPHMRRLGHYQDGGWDVCVSDIPLSSSRESSSCIVYSFGIAHDPSFDQDFVKYYPHCTVYAFDPSIGRQTGDPWMGKGIHFYSIGLGNANQTTTSQSKGWHMMDLPSIMRMLHHDHVHVLKMDVENSEWSSLRNWREQGHVLDRVDQVLAELHFFSMQQVSWQLDLLAWLRRDQHFHVFSRRDNFRGCRLRDIPVSDSESVRSYHCLEVGWRRDGKVGSRRGIGSGQSA